jgi:hypothetical protein
MDVEDGPKSAAAGKKAGSAKAKAAAARAADAAAAGARASRSQLLQLVQLVEEALPSDLRSELKARYFRDASDEEQQHTANAAAQYEPRLDTAAVEYIASAFWGVCPALVDWPAFVAVLGTDAAEDEEAAGAGDASEGEDTQSYSRKSGTCVFICDVWIG